MLKNISLMMLLVVSSLKLLALEEIKITGKISQNNIPLKGKLKMTVGRDQMVLADERSMTTYYAELDAMGNFGISFKASTKLTYVKFLLNDPNGIVIYSRNIPIFDKFFLFESGDDVVMNIDFAMGTLRLSGEGSGKLKCQYELQQLTIPLVLLTRLGTNSLEGKLEKADQIRLSYLNNCLTLLQTYKEELSDEAIIRIGQDLTARLKNDFMYYQYFNYSIESEMRRTIRTKYFLANYKKQSSFLEESPEMGSSPWYSEYLFNRERLISIFEKTTFNKGDVTKMYNAILKNYANDQRDKLILTFFISMAKRNFVDLEPLMSDAYQRMENREFKVAFRMFIDDNSAGKAVVNFSYVDEKDKFHQLSDFKDKILVLDFWFTGCHGCKQIPAVLRPVIEQFKDRDDVVFLSINIDKNKSNWKLGLESGDYTCEGQLHLNTAGRGADDELIRTYNINSYPRLFVIGKNGKLLASNPVDPRIDGAKAIRNYINEGLK